MVLVQLLLPLSDNQGRPWPRELFEQVRQELLERFGGMTAYARAPAKGLWTEPDHAVVRDDIVVHEVMAERLDRDWWAAYRRELERRFQQEALVIRAQEVELL
jgi:hypothetical protein